MANQYAETAAVLRAAQHWDDDQINCRSLTSHGWEPYTVRQHVNVPNKPFTIVQRCANCGNHRQRLMSSKTGDWLESGWRYTYSPGYLLPKGTGRVGASAKAGLRLLAIRGLKKVTVGGGHDA